MTSTFDPKPSLLEHLLVSRGKRGNISSSAPPDQQQERPPHHHHQQQQQQQSSEGNANPSSSLAHPSSTLTENNAFIRLTMNLPGVSKASDISVDIQRGVLLIRGVRNIMAPGDDDGEEQQVLKKHRFSRRFALDTDVV